MYGVDKKVNSDNRGAPVRYFSHDNAPSLARLCGARRDSLFDFTERKVEYFGWERR